MNLMVLIKVTVNNIIKEGKFIVYTTVKYILLIVVNNRSTSSTSAINHKATINSNSDYYTYQQED